MTPVSGTVLPKPDFFLESLGRNKTNPTESVEAAALPVLTAAAPFTPPRAPAPRGMTGSSPSVIASPIHPMDPSHDATALLNVPNRDLRKFKGKRKHVLLITDSAVRHSKVFSRTDVARHVSKATSLFNTDPSAPSISMVVEPGLALTMTKPDVVELKDETTGRAREFGFHRHHGRKNPYPIRGHGVVVAEQGSAVTPKHLLDIAVSYKKAPTKHPRQFVQDEISKLMAAASSSSEEPSSSQE